MESKKYECKTYYKTTQRNATCCLPFLICTKSNNGNASKLVEASSKCFFKLLSMLKVQATKLHKPSAIDTGEPTNLLISLSKPQYSSLTPFSLSQALAKDGMTFLRSNRCYTKHDQFT